LFKKEASKRIVYRGDILFEFANSPQPFADSKRFNPLVALPSPRDIPEVKSAVDECLGGLDKVWFKYWPQSTEPYRHIRDYFLKRTQYTHLIILPDDLVVNAIGVSRLLLTAYAEPDKYTVLMGNCPVVYGSLQFAITHNLPALKRSERIYRWWSLMDVQTRPGIHQVPHCGTPFAILARSVVEEVSFDNDKDWNDDDRVGFSEDVVLSHELHNLDIPLYVDTSVIFEHLKGKPGIPLV
jgi:hypothetical protein